MTDLIFEVTMQVVNVETSKLIHAGHRLPLISFDTQEEKEEVTVN